MSGFTRSYWEAAGSQGTKCAEHVHNVSHVSAQEETGVARRTAYEDTLQPWGCAIPACGPDALFSGMHWQSCISYCDAEPINPLMAGRPLQRRDRGLARAPRQGRTTPRPPPGTPSGAGTAAGPTGCASGCTAACASPAPAGPASRCCPRRVPLCMCPQVMTPTRVWK